MTKPIVATYFMLSSTGKYEYQTLLYDDGSTSCDCPGWTRRVATDGTRSCKHTRAVESGGGERMAERVSYSNSSSFTPNTSAREQPKKRKQPEPKPSPLTERAKRRFGFAKEGV